MNIIRLLFKAHRYSLGQRIDTFFVEIIESISIASFPPKEEKRSSVSVAIRKLDTLKVLLMVLWETKSLDNKKYIVLSLHLDEIGKMLGGWNGQLVKTKLSRKKQERNEKSCERQRTDSCHSSLRQTNSGSAYAAVAILIEVRRITQPLKLADRNVQNIFYVTTPLNNLRIVSYSAS